MDPNESRSGPVSGEDDRYDRYADIFDNPVTAESLELGNRVLHWAFAEWLNPREVIRQHALKAQRIARERAS
jgi:hypothetical protein